MFEKLTPIEDADLTVYEDAFEYIFANEDIRNVAISGPYSSGKCNTVKQVDTICNIKNQEGRLMLPSPV